MAREILFKAKRIDNGEWVEGSLLVDEAGNCYIGVYIYPRQETDIVVGGRTNGKTHRRFHGIGFTQVDSKTICQYTGLTDKNGNKIWENDVLEWTRQDIVLTSSPYHEGYRLGDRVKVKKLDSGFTLLALKNNSDIPNIVGNVKNYEFWNMQRFLEVIGNIFDNPELLGGADNG